MKKFLAILMTMALMFTLSGCGKLEDKTEDISLWKGVSEITDIKSSKNSYSATVEGKITALWDGDYTVNVEFYDKDDTLLYSGWDDIYGLSENQTAKFEVLCAEDDIAYFKVVCAMGI